MNDQVRPAATWPAAIALRTTGRSVTVYVVCAGRSAAGVNTSTRPESAPVEGLAVAGVVGRSSASSSTVTDPSTGGVMTSASRADAGSIGASKKIAMVPRGLAPATPSAGAVDRTDSPAATVVKLATNGAARCEPSVSVAPVPIASVYVVPNASGASNDTSRACWLHDAW